MNDGKDRLNFSNVESFNSKLLAIIINMNVRFIDISNRYQSSWNALSVISILYTE